MTHERAKRWHGLVLFLAALLGVECAPADAQERPAFRADRVLPANQTRRLPLIPGMVMSIYGENLGPVAGCVGQPDLSRRETVSPLRRDAVMVDLLVYPAELCETSVLVDHHRAGLLYVSAKQINFKVPQETPVEGTAELEVNYAGRRSGPVMMALGRDATVISLDGAAYVGMPVWLKVEMAWDNAVQYPSDIVAPSFGCNAVEVRRNGLLLQPFMTANSPRFGGRVFGGNPCGSLGLPAESRWRGRLPLHLQYRFDVPGTYEVRFTMWTTWPAVTAQRAMRAQSPWTAIEVRAAAPGQRANWLAGVRRRAPDDATELLSDVLPGVLGVPDAESLDLLAPYLYHSNNLVREYAMYGLAYWQDEKVSAALLALLHARGPSDMLIEGLSRGVTRQAHAEEIVRASLPYFQSASPVAIGGAITAVNRFVGLATNSFSEPFRQEIVSAMVAADGVVERADQQTIGNFATALATIRDARTRALLWSLVHRDVAAEQALICLTWLAYGDDLPKLGAMLTGSTHYQGLNNLPYALHRAYGDRALPYLRAALNDSPYADVKEACERELQPVK